MSVGKVPLKIVGDGPLKEALTCHAQSIDTSRTIEFLGHRNRSDVIELVKRCRFLVLPSEWYEVLGYAILEAFACAKPVIASHIGGIPELVTDGKTGYLFTPGDTGDLASKITTIIADPQKSMKLGLNGRKMIEENLNGEIHYTRLMELYSKFIHQV